MIGTLFDDALATGQPVEVEYTDGSRSLLPLPRWCGGSIPGDARLLERCRGATLDVGCGPGRLAAAVTRRGLPALGIDLAPNAVRSAQARGAMALRRDVFGPLPGGGRWETVLLADGNVGIGGDPNRLLRRVAELLAAGGQALVELVPAEHGRGSCAARLHSGGRRGAWFQWAEVGLTDLPSALDGTGLQIAERWTEAGRWFACLV